MSLFKEIKIFGELFHSIRQHEQYFVIDLKIPLTWEFEPILMSHQKQLAYKINNENDTHRLISFFSTMNEGSVNLMSTVVQEVIKVNREVEEKRNLLLQKKVELENMFNNFSLNELKNISFNVETQLGLKQLQNFNEEIDENRTEGSTVVTEEAIEGPEGDSQV
tara:strand:+ start:12226 stop:12717 length:492 start_codon:yes stop_codon:yes gene_type:complete